MGLLKRLNFPQVAMWQVLFLAIGMLCISTNATSSDGSVGSDPDDRMSYKGYQLIEIQTNASNDLNLLRSFEDSIDFWSFPRYVGDRAIASVAPSVADDFIAVLSKGNISFTLLVADLENTFAHERRQQRISEQKNYNRSVSFDAYPRASQINSYLDQLVKDYPHLVTVVDQATTLEHRPIRYVKISNGGSNARSIFIDAGIHAREWIAPATALYVIHQLVENSAQNQDLLDRMDWVILPLANPDGYEYSHTTERLWRKNRRVNPTSPCFGVDGNRNYDFQWGVVGSSTDPCSQAFQGPVPFSEIETQVVRDIMESVKSTCKMYISLHSFSKALLYPWGYISDLPDTWRDLDQVARAGADAIRAATFTKYRVGSAENVLYAASGASDDYAFAVKKIPIAITMELPGGGAHGFDMPAHEIRSTVNETWIGIRAMALKVSEKY